MQSNNMDAAQQMRLLFGSMDSPMMMPMQMPFIPPTSTSSSTPETHSEKAKGTDTSNKPSALIPGYPSPGILPYSYGMFPYGPGISPVQLPLMLPMGAHPLMPYGLFSYPGMVNPRDTDSKSGTALLKELSDNSKKTQSQKMSSCSDKSANESNRSLQLDHRSSIPVHKSQAETTSRHSGDAKNKTFSNISSSTIKEGFRDRDSSSYLTKSPKTLNTPLDFTAKSQGPMRGRPRKPRASPRHDQYLHLLQRSSLHHDLVRKREKTNTAKLKIEALIDFGQKKPTLSNLKLDLEKELEENLKESTFGTSNERYKFSPDTTSHGEERKTDDFHCEAKCKRFTNHSDTISKCNEYNQYTMSRNSSQKSKRKIGHYPGEFKHSSESLSPEMDLEEPSVLRGEAHQVRLARYNAQRLRDSFFRSSNSLYVEQVEPDSTGDCHDELGQLEPKQLKTHNSKVILGSDLLPPSPKWPRSETPPSKSGKRHHELQDINVDSSLKEDAGVSTSLKDTTVRDKILSYIKSRSNRKRDEPPTIPTFPVQDLKLQPGLSIVDSWKHQLAPSIETTTEASLEDSVLNYWRQSLETDFCQTVSMNGKLNSSHVMNNRVEKSEEVLKNGLDLEPGEIVKHMKVAGDRSLGPTLPAFTLSYSDDIGNNISLDKDEKEMIESGTVAADSTISQQNEMNISPLSVTVEGSLSVSSPMNRVVSPVTPDKLETNKETSEPAVKDHFIPDKNERVDIGVVSNSLVDPTVDERNGPSIEAETKPLSPKLPHSSSDSETSVSSSSTKVCNWKTDDANTVSAAFALEAVKALDCISEPTSINLFHVEASISNKVDNSDKCEMSIVHSSEWNDTIAQPNTGKPVLKKKQGRKLKKKLKLRSKKHSVNSKQNPSNVLNVASSDPPNAITLTDARTTDSVSIKSRPNGSAAQNTSGLKRGRGRPPKYHNSLGLGFAEVKKRPGRPPKVKSGSLKVPPNLNHLENVAGINGNLDTTNVNVDQQPQRKKRSPLFYGCNYNDKLLMSAMRIRLPDTEKKIKKKHIRSHQKHNGLSKVHGRKFKNEPNRVLESGKRDNVSSVLDSVGLGSVTKTKECSVLLKDVSSYLCSEEKNVNIKDSTMSTSVAPLSEKENKDCSSVSEVRKSVSGSRVSRPQTAKRSKPLRSKQQLAGNRLVLVKDPLKNGYFVKYSDALREEAEKLGSDIVQDEVVSNISDSVNCFDTESRFEDDIVVSENSDEVLTEEHCQELPESEFLDFNKKPSLVDRFKSTLLNESCGRRRGLSQRSRSTDDLSSIKPASRNKRDVTKSSEPLEGAKSRSPSEREERVSALKERLKLEQAAVAEIQWKRLERGAQSE